MSNIIEVYEKLLNNKDFSDVLITVDKSQIWSHKLVLGMNSVFFRQGLYEGQHKEHFKYNESTRMFEISLSELPYEEVLNVLSFCYLRKISLRDENVVAIFKFAEKYDFGELKTVCGEFLAKNITANNCLQILTEFKVQSLTNQVFRFLSEDVTPFEKENLFVGFSDTVLLEQIISLEAIAAPEISVLRRIMEWGRWMCSLEKMDVTKPENIKTFIGGYLKYIRLDLMGKEEFLEIAKTGLYSIEELTAAALRTLGKLNTDKHPLSRGPPTIKRENIKVLHLSANTKKWIENVRESIMSTGIKTVESVSVETNTPTLEEMKKFHVVWLDSCRALQNATELGNRLASYIEQGGSVVISSVHTLRNDEGKWVIQGRIRTGGFLPITIGELRQDKKGGLGYIVKREHMIAEGVKSFDGGKMASRLESSPTEGAEIVIKWDDGLPMIVEKVKDDNERYGVCIALNLRAPDNTVDRKYWDKKTDGALLIANTVEYAASKSKLQL